MIAAFNLLSSGKESMLTWLKIASRVGADNTGPGSDQPIEGMIVMADSSIQQIEAYGKTSFARRRA